jgi:hypothetical protein
MKKVCLLIDSLRSGGAQNQVIAYAIFLKEKNFDVEIIFYHNLIFYKDILSHKNIKATYLPSKNKINLIWNLFSYFYKNKFQIIIGFLETPSFICELYKIFNPSVFVVANERSADPNILKSIKLISLRYFHFFSNHIICNSNANKNLIFSAAPFLSKRKVSVVYNKVVRRDYIKTEIFKKDEGLLNITIVASHLRNKNLQNLIHAVNLLDTNLKDKIVIRWFGDNISPPYLDDSFEQNSLLIKSMNLSKNFHFFPSNNDVFSIYDLSDVIALFSFVEGLPNSLTEAISICKPIIASNISDIPLIISNKNLLFNPNNIESIKLCLEYLFKLDKEHLLLEGIRNKELYNNLTYENSLEKFVTKYLI